ncbi:MAG: TIGR01212 family radical SAM protein [Bacteroidales bacterium]|nr:TIGR01212 family radical SAM protein [Bacteroidales bacterium]
MYEWGHKRRYNAFSNYCVLRFGERLQKVSINAGLTCPNRDGTIGTEGCYYCNNKAFNPSYCDGDKNISLQISEGIEFLSNRYRRAHKYLAYFQTYTNTYAPIEQLKKMYDEALSFPEMAGIVIATRPDCVNDEILDYFAELSKKTFVSIEYGIESCHNRTLRIINRGHSFEDAEKAIKLTADRKIHTGIHLIFGLPDETRDDVIVQSDIISKLPINSLKIHQLQIMKDTKMELMYRENPGIFYFYSLEEYIDLIIEFVEKLNPDISVDRFAGEAPPRFLIGPSFMQHPDWGFIRNDQLLQMIEKKMEQMDTWQGKKFVIK